MAFRSQGPADKSSDPQPLDEGTLVRALTPSPQPTGSGSDRQEYEGFLDLGYRGYREDAHEPRIRIRIVGHASPRWRSATASIGNQKNFELAMRRANAVKAELEKLLGAHSTLQFVQFAVSLENEEGTVAVQATSHGNHDTLKEANNDRSDNHPERRRVDVYFEVSTRKTGEAGVCVPISYRTTRTREWLVSVSLSAGFSLAVVVQMLKIKLINGRTKDEMQGTAWTIGGGGKFSTKQKARKFSIESGPGVSVGANLSIWSAPVPFTTKEEINFEDFRNVAVRYTTFGASAKIVGYEFSYISFVGLGPGAQHISVGGWNTGTIGVGGSVTAGPYRSDGTEPPTRIPIKGSDESKVSYERNDSMTSHHQVRFATNDSKISSVEGDLLDSLVRSILNQ